MNGARNTRRFPHFTLVEPAPARPSAANHGFVNGRDEVTAVSLGPAIPRSLANGSRGAHAPEAPRSTLLPEPPRRSAVSLLPDLTFDDTPQAPTTTRDEGSRLSDMPLADLVNYFARIAREREGTG